jgi:hypothetical protein
MILSPPPVRDKYKVEQDRGGQWWADIPLSWKIWFDRLAFNYKSISNVTSSTTLTSSGYTAFIEVTGLTVTLTPAAANIISDEWTIILGVAGIVTIVPNGSDTINLPTTDNSISMTNKGASVTLRCLSATTWGIV